MTAKRYRPVSRFWRDLFGAPVYKIPLDAGFTCPNRDGTVGRGGCSFCRNVSFGPYADRGMSLEAQIEAAVTRMRRRRRGEVKFLAYIQNYTGTYAAPDRLKEVYDAALSHRDVIGLAVGTRPDCVPDPVLDLLQTYAARWHVWLEYGLQSIHDRTLARLNRGHTAAQFRDAVIRTRGRGIFIAAHVILGLPGETVADAVETAEALTELGLDGVKIHHLQVIEGTPLAQEWREGNVPVLSPEEYVHWVCTFLEHLSPQMVIHRLIGDVLDGELLLAPRWGVTKTELISMIDCELAWRDTRQGARIRSR